MQNVSVRLSESLSPSLDSFQDFECLFTVHDSHHAPRSECAAGAHRGTVDRPGVDEGSSIALASGDTVPVDERYLGHRSPEMTMHYAATLAQTHEREFLRLAKIGRDGRPLDLDPADIYELAQLDRRTDRILPNGVCLLPPTKRCDKGNACARCEHFATDRSHLSEHRQQLAATLQLIEQRKAQHLQRTGTEMTQDNVWLDARIAETGSLQMIITALENEVTGGGCALRGAGTPGRAAPGTP